MRREKEEKEMEDEGGDEDRVAAMRFVLRRGGRGKGERERRHERGGRTNSRH